jgi:hypothetical protein
MNDEQQQWCRDLVAKFIDFDDPDFDKLAWAIEDLIDGELDRMNERAQQ